MLELTRKTVNLIKSAGKMGVTNYELVDLLNAHRRRISDITTILKALGMVTTLREQKGTRIIWNESTQKIFTEVNDTLQEHIFVDASSLTIRSTSKITRVSPMNILELRIESESPGFIIEVIDTET